MQGMSKSLKFRLLLVRQPVSAATALRLYKGIVQTEVADVIETIMRDRVEFDGC